MLALVLDGRRVVLDRARSRPEPKGNLVRVRTRVAGICNTDLELVRGYMGFGGVLGHEFVGEAIDGALAGRRVVGGINFGCGDCPVCADGMERHCPRRRVLGILAADGTLAEEFVIPERNLRVVPDGVSDDAAAFAEPVAAACEVLEQVGAIDGREALVIGDGKLGPLLAQVLASAGARTTLVGRHVEGLGWLADRGIELGAEAARSRLYDLVVDASGSPDGLGLALSRTRPRGTLVLKTTVAGRYDVDLAPAVINEITIVGSRCGRMEQALECLSDGRVDVSPLVAARFSLTRAAEALEAAARRGTRKVLVEVD